jgi:1-acyl-sn-glycerol-3-phosphate acyltransferase
VLPAVATLCAVEAERTVVAGEESSEPERTVVELLRELLPAPLPIDRSDSLAELGLDSLASADLAIGIEERLGVRLPDADDLELQTVGDVIDGVRRGAPARHRVDPTLGTLLPAITTVGGPFVRAYGRLRVEGAEHVPPTGAVVIAANHRSMFDIPVMVVATPRPVFFMAKRELYRGPVLTWVWRRLGGFPVRRQIADLRAIDTALALLEREAAVVLYPEGTRSRYGDMLPFLLGSAWLALKTGSPIVPAGVVGTGRQPGWNGRVAPWLRKHVRVRFGQAIPVERVEDRRQRRLRAEALTTELAGRVEALMA